MKHRIVTRREKRRAARIAKRFPVVRYLRERVDYWVEGGEFDRKRRVYRFGNGSEILIAPTANPLVSTQWMESP